MLMSKEVIVTEPHKFEVREVPRPEAASMSSSIVSGTASRPSSARTFMFMTAALQLVSSGRP